MYTPNFPYKGNQVILSSDRITLHGKKDSIFLFGNQSVSLSSKNTVNIDAKSKFTVSTPLIELGNNASNIGESVILGDTFVEQFNILLDALQTFSKSLENASYSNLETIQTNIAIPANQLSNIIPQVQTAIKNTIRSKKVFIQKND